MAAVYFLDAFAVRESRQNLDCQDILPLQCLGDGGRANLDTVRALSLGPERLPDEVS